MMNTDIGQLRAFQIDLDRQMERPDKIAQIIRQGADLGYNALLLYAGGALQFDSHPQITPKVALTKRDFTELQALAESVGVELMLCIPVLGHAGYILRSQAHQSLAEGLRGQRYIVCDHGQLCISTEQTYALIRDLLAEWAGLSHSMFLHVGCDESWDLAVCPTCRQRAEAIGVGGLLVEHLNRVNTIVRDLGKRTIIWADMLLYYSEKHLDDLSRDIVLADWHYREIDPYPRLALYGQRRVPTLERFTQLDFDVICCTKSSGDFHASAVNIAAFTDYAARSNVLGTLNTTWGLRHRCWDTLWPALAYGARTATTGRGPNRFAFLRQWVSEHFRGEVEDGVELVNRVSQAQVTPEVDHILDLIEYRPMPTDQAAAEHARHGLQLAWRLMGVDAQGQGYLNAAGLQLRRAWHRHALKDAMNRITLAILRNQDDLVDEAAGDLQSLRADADELLSCERAVWDAARYAHDPMPAAEALAAEQAQLVAFLDAVRQWRGRVCEAHEVLPGVLQLTLLNPAPAWQMLTVEVATDDDDWRQVYQVAQSHWLFVDDRLTIRLPSPNVRRVRLSVSGFGELGVLFCELRSAHGRRIPDQVLDSAGPVLRPEHLTRDDLSVTWFGSSDTPQYFRQARQQPTGRLTLGLVDDPDFRWQARAAGSISAAPLVAAP